MKNDDFLGGFFDFNSDGQTDLSEEYIAYKMIMDSDDYSNDDYCSSSISGSSISHTVKAVLCVLLIILVIGWILKACESNSNSKTTNSYSRNYKHYSGSSYKSRSSTYSYQSNNTYSSAQPSTKKSTYKSYSSKPKSNKSNDEYNAKDYVNADDFYYDHYDDFYDYEDAEDYYNEHAD